MRIKTITPNELHDLRTSGTPVDLIDVRTPAEFREVHAEGARLVPLDRLDPQALLSARGNSIEPLYLICRSGSRARQACERILAAGFPNVVSVEGGTLAWEQVGLPVVRGKKAVSLERQVRIAAGSLVLLGAALALTVHPWFAVLSAFVGAGLVFAGVTDTCGMGLLLGRMPWNQVKESGAACVPAPGGRRADQPLPGKGGQP
jgi:rhodanese-related sulfurtransferase